LQAGLPLGGTATLVIGRGAIPPDGAADLPGVAGLGSERSLLRLCFAGSRPVLHRDGAMAPCRLPFDPGEDEPAAALAQLLGGQEVRLSTDPTQDRYDRYDRLLAHVWLPDGRSFEWVMVADGFAHEYTYDLPYTYQREYQDAERQARDAGRGLWAPDTCSGDTTVAAA
jgi:hypothetical protein